MEGEGWRGWMGPAGWRVGGTGGVDGYGWRGWMGASGWEVLDGGASCKEPLNLRTRSFRIF